MTGGTPKNLHEAIKNGINEPSAGIETDDVIASLIEQHVLDYLRQQFGVAYLALSENPEDEPAFAAVQALAQGIGVDTKGLKDAKE